MKEVSCRHFSYWFDLLEKNGRSVDRSISRLPYNQEFLLASGNRIDWNEYVIFCEDCIAELGGMDAVRQLPQNYGNSGEMGYLRKIVGLFASPRKVYEFIILKHGHSLYTHLDFQLVDLPDGRLQIRIRIPEEYDDSPEWFWASEPSFASMTQLIGLPPAKITTEVHERLGLYTLTLPQSSTLLSRFQRIGRSLLAPFGYRQFIDTQQAELRNLIRDIEAERDTLNHLISSLPVGILILRDKQARFFNLALGQMLGFGSVEEWQNDTDSILPKIFAEAKAGMRFDLPTGRLVEVVSHSPITTQSLLETLIVIRDVTELQRIEDRIAEAATQERQKLAHDLHDGLGQYFAALNYKASALAGRSESSPQELKQVAELAREAATLSREIIHGMGPSYADGDDLVAALRKLCARMENLFPASFPFESEASSARPDPPDADEIFLMVKEALTNAAKHSGASTIRLRLQTNTTGWTILVTDDGAGFDSAQVLQGEGLGLGAMELRASRLGGRLKIHSQPGQGCEVVLEISSSLLRPVQEPMPSRKAPPLDRPIPSRTEARIFLADDHAIVRDGVRRLIESEEGLIFCGEAGQTSEVIPKLNAAAADVLVIDWLWGRQDGEETIKQIRREFPDITMIVLSMFAAETHRPIALAAGANEFVNKSDPPERLLEVLRQTRSPCKSALTG